MAKAQNLLFNAQKTTRHHSNSPGLAALNVGHARAPNHCCNPRQIWSFSPRRMCFPLPSSPRNRKNCAQFGKKNQHLMLSSLKWLVHVLDVSTCFFCFSFTCGRIIRIHWPSTVIHPDRNLEDQIDSNRENQHLMAPTTIFFHLCFTVFTYSRSTFCFRCMSCILAHSIAAFSTSTRTIECWIILGKRIKKHPKPMVKPSDASTSRVGVSI